MTDTSRVNRVHAPAGASAGRAGRNNVKRLHLGHFAFMRAVLQGLDARESWRRYLQLEGGPEDASEVRKTIQWIRDEFAIAARRLSRYGIARLILLDAARVTDRQAVVPSLEEFAEQHGLQDFSFAEQLESYESYYGKASQRQSRRSRLLARQLEALQWLENVALHPPQAGDPVAVWLHPNLAVRMEQGGIVTLRQLVERINGIGRRWWVSIPAIGAGKAERIVDWLWQQQSALQLFLGDHVEQKRSTLTAAQLRRVVPQSTAIVPLDKLVIPGELDGTFGRYRSSDGTCQLRATTDLDAALEWLDTKTGRALPTGADRSHTGRAYLKEIERFILWAIVQRKTSLSSMTTEDCLAYCRFIENPAPTELWCGQRGRGKWSPLWRPFEGALSVRAQRQAITILKSLYKYLAEQHYLTTNAWEAVALPAETGPRVNKARSFSHSEWACIERTLDELPETSVNRRLKLALPLLYATGLRLAEVVNARVGDLHQSRQADAVDVPSQDGWHLNVAGHGAQARQVPVPSSVMHNLSSYLASRGLPPDPAAFENRDAAILGKAIDVAERVPWSARASHAIDPKAGIASGTLYDQLKAFFALCSSTIPASDVRVRRAFSTASTQWLRHTHHLHRREQGE